MNKRRSFINLKRYKRTSFKLLIKKGLNYNKKRNFLLNYQTLLKKKRWKKKL